MKRIGHDNHDFIWQIYCDCALRLLRKAADAWHMQEDKHFEADEVLAVVLRVLGLRLCETGNDSRLIEQTEKRTLDEWLQLVNSPVVELGRIHSDLDRSLIADVAKNLTEVIKQARSSWVVDSPEIPATSSVLDTIIEELYRTRIVIRKPGM